MFTELHQAQFEKVRSLFQGFDYSLSLLAALEGNNPGRIFVDDLNDPRTALALTVEGYLLTGAEWNSETEQALKHLFKEQIFSGKVAVNGDWSMSLAIYPESWAARLPQLIPTHEVEKIDRFHYLCHRLQYNWRKHIPAGYEVRRVDRALLDDPEIVFPDMMGDWMDIDEMWGSEENFLSNGISYAVLCGSEVVSWYTPDCFAGDRLDGGIITHPAHRRRGLAALAVAATVEHCLDHGIYAVGWHCNVENIASWKTAEKVGFERNREYAYYFYIYDSIDHLAELGWYYYRRGEYARTVQYYEQVFAQRDDNPDYYYHLAASAWALLGDRDNAANCLQAALDHGWVNIAWTVEQEEFAILDDSAVWRELLDQ